MDLLYESGWREPMCVKLRCFTVVFFQCDINTAYLFIYYVFAFSAFFLARSLFILFPAGSVPLAGKRKVRFVRRTALL